MNQALANVNYEYRYKLVADEPDQYLVPGRFAADFSVGSQVGLGNLATFLSGQFEYRFGWGLPMCFTKAPDPLGIGIMLDPIYIEPAPRFPEVRAWRTYFTLVGRIAYISRLAPAEGGETINGGEHPKLDSYPGKYQALLGYHLARIPFAIHLTYYRYFAQDELGIEASGDWINFSFEYRF